MFPNGEVFTPTDTVYGVFNTFDPDTGAPITLGGTPALRLERVRSGTWSEITGNGITLRVDEDDTGRQEYELDLDDANIAAAAGDTYRVALNAGTVNGESVVGVVVGYFYVLADGLTTQQKADVEAESVDALESLRLDHLVAVADADDVVDDSIVAKLASGDGDWSTFTGASAGIYELLTRITSTLFNGITSLAEWLGLLAGKQTGDATARTEIRATGAGSGTFDETTDSVEAIRDTEPLGTAMRGTDGANTTTPPTVAAIQAELEEDGASILDTLRDRLTAARATNLDELGSGNIPADVDTLLSRATETRLAQLDAGNIPGDLAAVLVDTGTTIPGLIAALNDLDADGVWDEVIEDSRTARQLLRLFASALLAKVSGMDTTTPAFRDLADTKDRINATVDSDGNRSVVTLDGS